MAHWLAPDGASVSSPCDVLLNMPVQQSAALQKGLMRGTYPKGWLEPACSMASGPSNPRLRKSFTP